MKSLTFLSWSGVGVFLVFNYQSFADSGLEAAAIQAQMSDSISVLEPNPGVDGVDSTASLKSSSPQQSWVQSEQEELKDDLFQRLRVDRRVAGVPESNMTTHRLTHLVTQEQVYQFVAHQGVVALSPEEVISAKIRRWGTELEEPPAGLDYVELAGSWNSDAQGEADESNILGGYGELRLAIEGTQVRVPIVQATEDRLSYYKAHLLESGDQFRFETQSQFPLFEMSVGQNYVPTFIMNGKGLYLEYHNEPHYHEPMDADARGVYLLARMMRDEVSGREWVRISGFRIPFGTAVYSEPWAIHDDATTIGNWRVGYINAQVFSTVVIRNQAHQKVGIQFFEPEQSLE